MNKMRPSLHEVATMILWDNFSISEHLRNKFREKKYLYPSQRWKCKFCWEFIKPLVSLLHSFFVNRSVIRSKKRKTCQNIAVHWQVEFLSSIWKSNSDCPSTILTINKMWVCLHSYLPSKKNYLNIWFSNNY